MLSSKPHHLQPGFVIISHLAPPQAPPPAPRPPPPCTAGDAPADTQVLVTPLQRLLIIYRPKPKLLTFIHLSNLIPYNLLSYPRLLQPHGLELLPNCQLAASLGPECPAHPPRPAGRTPVHSATTAPTTFCCTSLCRCFPSRTEAPCGPGPNDTPNQAGVLPPGQSRIQVGGARVMPT